MAIVHRRNLLVGLALVVSFVLFKSAFQTFVREAHHITTTCRACHLVHGYLLTKEAQFDVPKPLISPLPLSLSPQQIGTEPSFPPSSPSQPDAPTPPQDHSQAGSSEPVQGPPKELSTDLFSEQATERPKEPPKELPAVDDLLKREKEIMQKEALLRAREAQLNLRDQILFQEEELVAKKSRPPPERSLISYVYVESPTNRRNLKFFIQHALYDSADFVFTFNGETDAHELLPSHPKSPWYNPKVQNIEVIHRENKCLDFGAHGEALLREWDAEGKVMKKMEQEHKGGKLFWENYSRFILMNASIRGPFMPYWSKDCWSEVFWNLVTEKVKLVGMSYNCHGDMGHLQSMIWATDRIGIALLMQHPPAGVGYWCPIDMVDAIYGETRTTPTIHSAGYEIDALTAVYHSHDGDDLNADGRPDHSPHGYLKGCTTDDFFHENAYHGFNIHPYETIFMKSARKMQEILLGNLTQWADGSGYSSYDYCDAISFSKLNINNTLIV